MPTALVIKHVEGKAGQVYYPLVLSEYETRQPKENEVVVRMTAAALNHRDLFIRQNLYPGVGFGIPLGADGCGTVIKTGSATKEWLNKRVVFNPGSGWKDDPDGPESKAMYATLGGTKLNPAGTAVDEFVTDVGELEEAPAHMTAHEAAALPLAGLTAWRATVTKSGNALPGRNLLVTGIGGGVAIMALLIGVAAGARVWVSSGSADKIARAVQMGAQGGVSYKEKAWEKKLTAMLPKDRPYLDAIIDGAGGDVVEKAARLLKPGGAVAIYGMTTGPKMPFLMSAVLKNIEIRGSTMGSRKEFADMVAFVNKHGIKPVVSKVSKGGLKNLEEIDGLFEDMKNGSQFGKLVIEIAKESEVSKL